MRHRALSSLVVMLVIAATPAWSANKEVKTSGFEESIKKAQLRVPVTQQDRDQQKKTASTLLISCVDFRLRHETENLMRSQLHLLDDYDEVALPGASLGMVLVDHPHWRQTLEDIISLVEQLHQIKQIILLDHRDCGAYKLIKGPEYATSTEAETAIHKQTLLEAKAVLQAKFPAIKVYTMLLGLDGVVDNF